MSYIKSADIEVFPSGFRSAAYAKGTLTTENNFTMLARVASIAMEGNGLYKDPADAAYGLINISGYVFRTKLATIPDAKFARISTRIIDGLGSVLAPVNAAGDCLDSGTDFVGIEFGDNGSGQFAKIRDDNGNFIFANNRISAITADTMTIKNPGTTAPAALVGFDASGNIVKTGVVSLPYPGSVLRLDSTGKPAWTLPQLVGLNVKVGAASSMVFDITQQGKTNIAFNQNQFKLASGEVALNDVISAPQSSLYVKETHINNGASLNGTSIDANGIKVGMNGAEITKDGNITISGKLTASSIDFDDIDLTKLDRIVCPTIKASSSETGEANGIVTASHIESKTEVTQNLLAKSITVNGTTTIGQNINTKNLFSTSVVTTSLTATDEVTAPKISGVTKITGGDISIEVNPAARTAMMDGRLNIRDVSGSVALSVTGMHGANALMVADGNLRVDTGTVWAQNITNASDRRLKENIEDYTCEKSILDLPVKKFDYINGQKGQIGCIAQDLQQICPEIVKEDQDGYLGIQESKIVYLLLDEVKKLRKELDELKGAK